VSRPLPLPFHPVCQDRSFRYASPRLWNQRPDSFRQPHHSRLDSSPHPLLTLVIHHSFTLSIQAQNLPFQQILPTVDFFYLLDCLTITGLDRTYHAHHFIFSYDTIRYDSVYLTCSKKLTGSQLISLPHGINKKLALCIRRTRTRVMLHVFGVMLHVFRLMLHVFLVMLHVFPVMLQVFRVMLQVFPVTVEVFPVMLQVFLVMLQVFLVMLHVFRLTL